MSRLTFPSIPGSIMLSKLSILARLAVIAVTLFLFFTGVTGVLMVYWALGAGFSLATLLRFKRKTPKGEKVGFPKQIPIALGRTCYTGTQRAFTTYFGGWAVDQEAINMAAMRREDGFIIAVDHKGGYAEIVNTLFMMRLIRSPERSSVMNWERGYITSEGQWVTGKKVIKIARLAGQLPLDTPMQRLLSIEDLNPQDEAALARQAMAVVG